MANPALVVPIADQTVTKGQSVSFGVTTNLVDADAVDRLLFSATGLPTNTGLSIDSGSGVLSGTVSAADIAAIPFTVTVTAVAVSNGNITGSFEIEFDGLDEEPATEANYYVSSTATGSGIGTLVSPWTASQAALLNPIVLSPTPVTDVYIDWAPGNYDSYIPRYGGISADVRIVNRVGSAGVVRFRGPDGSSRDNGIELRQGIYSGVVYSTPFIEFERGADRNFEIDGRLVMGSGAGECGKGENPELFGTVKRGMLVESSGHIIDLDITRTAGWNGIDIGPLAASNVYRINYTQHGTPYYGSDDFGDMVWQNQGMGPTQRHLWDASATATRNWNQPGHLGPSLLGGTGAFRCQTLNGSWADVETFSAGDGNRCLVVSRNATNYHVYNCVINRGGEPADTDYCENMKCEGTSTSVSDCVMRNPDNDIFNNTSFDGSYHARNGRISHCVFEHMRGGIARMDDYLFYNRPGQSPLSGYQIKNCIVRNLATAERSGFEDVVLSVFLADGLNWTNVIQIHGLTIEDATRNASQLYFRIEQGISPPGTISIADAMASYPANFSNITVTTDCGLDDAPSAATNVDAEDIATYYTLNPADTTSKAQGVSLTLANGAGSSSTTLVVDDSRWFDDPQDGAPPFGQQSEGFYVHLNGANRQYTAINYTTHTLTLASAATWADNAPVNKKISSGSTPNRGVIR
jgi:hypothetical protein